MSHIQPWRPLHRVSNLLHHGFNAFSIVDNYITFVYQRLHDRDKILRPATNMIG